MNLDAYDDMMGLEFGDMEQFMNRQMLTEALIASTAGGGAILAATWGVKMLSEQFDLASTIPNPLLRSAVVSGATFLLGVASGRMVYEYNREAAMGIVGGLGGIAMANFIDAAISQMTGQERILNNGLGDNDASLLSADYDDGMEALAALETTGVTSAPGAFSDPSVTPEALMGFDGTVVQEETLGAYQPYLS